MKNKSLHSSSTFHLSISKQFTSRKNYAIQGNIFSPAQPQRKLQHGAVQRLVPGHRGACDGFSDLTQARECCLSPLSPLSPMTPCRSPHHLPPTPTLAVEICRGCSGGCRSRCCLHPAPLISPFFSRIPSPSAFWKMPP